MGELKLSSIEPSVFNLDKIMFSSPYELIKIFPSDCFVINLTSIALFVFSS